ncbi:unnamed protein product [Umbelopsis ramanniana]
MSARLFSSPILAAVKRSGVRFQSTAGFAAERDAVKHHAESAANTWKKSPSSSAFLLFLPLHPHEWVGYDYMNTRTKDFFWGKESLFFNPKVNHSAAEE